MKAVLFYIIAILFIFPSMFETNMLVPETIQIIANCCQRHVVTSLFSNMTL